MRCATPRCPTCGELAAGTLETLSGRAGLAFDDAGNADWAGGTDLFWDEQLTVRDRRGRVTLLCRCGTDWPSEVEGADAPVDAAGAPDAPATSPKAPAAVSHRTIDVVRDALAFVGDAGFDDFVEWLRDEHRLATLARPDDPPTLVLPTDDELTAAADELAALLSAPPA